jgi:predicted permease
MIDSLFQDLRHAVRALTKRPAFTAVAVLTFALGIGANTAIFTLVNSLLLTPLPYRQPDRLAILWESQNANPRGTNVVSPANYLDWKDRATSFTDLAALTWSNVTFTGDLPELVPGRAVTPNFFDLLGVAPERGRVFTADEARRGGPRVILLSDGLWRRRFGGDPAIVGRAVPVAGGSALVVGVMPPALRPMPWGEEEYWEPFRLSAGDRVRGGRYAMVVGRLRSGVTYERAQMELSGIAHTLEQEYPGFNTGWTVNLVSLADQVVGSARRTLLMLMGAVALVLFIACANVANLLLGRAVGRQREIAVRTALGASRWRVTRQGLVESVLLSLAGGVAGALLAVWGVGLLVAARPSAVPRLAEVGVDVRVLAATTAVSLLVGFACGLATALGDATRAVASMLRSAGTRATAARAALRFRSGLVAGQVSLALVLLAGAGLLVRSLQKLEAVDPGFDPANLLTVSLDLPAGTYPGPARQVAFYSQLLERVRGLPGVAAVGAVSVLPLTGQNSATAFSIVGRPAPAPGQGPVADIRVADPDYFHAMRIPLRRGRTPTAADRPGSPSVIVVNEKLVRQIWPGEDPIGRRVKVNWIESSPEAEVIGVVGDVHGAGLDGDIRPTIYYPQAQRPAGSMWLVIRHAGDPVTLTTAVRAAVRQLDRNLPVPNGLTMYARLVRSMSDRRYPMLVLSIFAGLAVLLSTVGLYGVLAYAVSQRTAEIGIRVALGAQVRDVVGLVVTQGLRVVGLGVAIGLAGAVATTRVLRSLLYGVAATDPATLLAVSLGLVAIAALAAYVPARRATKVDPMVALRCE